MSRLRRLLSPEIKKKIVDSLLFRVCARMLMSKKWIRFSVELTTKCNLRCAMCTRSLLMKNHKLDIGEMDDFVVDRIVGEMKKFLNKGYEVEFAPMGLGEPLMYSKIDKLIKRIKKVSSKIKIVLVTNGVLMNEDIATKLIKLNVDEISISLNVKSSSNYKKYLGGNNYNRVVANIKNLIDIRNRLENNKVSIFIQYLNYKNENFGKEVGCWRKIMRYGDKCYVHPIVNQAGFYRNGVDNTNDGKFPCCSPLSRVGIKINGDIYPCDPCFYSGKGKISDLLLGNIKKDNVWKIFKDRKSKNYSIVKMMREGDYSKIPTCEKCDTYKLGINCFFKNPLTKKWM